MISKNIGGILMRLSYKGVLVFLLLLMFVIAGCSSSEESDADDGDTDQTTEQDDSSKESSEESDESAEDNEFGGEIKVAINAQPPTLDPHMTTAGATSDISKMAFEALLTIDSKYNPVPMLAEDYEVNDNNTVFTFYLRKGVKFHNGKEMTAEDVVASMNRWKELSGVASNTFGDAEFVAIDDYTVQIELDEPSGIAIGVMASNEQFAAIMPKEVIESAPVEGVTEFIGTGPYQFVEWKQDQYIHYTRYEDYQPVDREPDGISGRKVAYIDDVYYYIVTDPSTRLAGLQSGEYDIAYALPSDNYDMLMAAEDIEVQSLYSSNIDLLYNKRGGLMQNPLMRKAVNALLDIDEIMKAALVNENIYRLDASYMSIDIEQWATEVGKEFYNMKDPELAKQLFEEAGYNGEEIVLMTTRDYEQYYNASVVIKEQLDQIGVNAILEVYDWPTIVERREESDTWDLFVNAYPFKADPTQLLQLNPSFAGGINDPKADELMDAIRKATSQEEAREKWEELQYYAWSEYLPMTKLGSQAGMYGVRDRLENVQIAPGGSVLWNAKVVK